MTDKKGYPFLGTGWSFPPEFSEQGANIEMDSGPENVHKSIRILLETNLGERVMRQDFGCALDNYLFEPISDRLLNDLKHVVRSAIQKHEPRAKLENVDIDLDQTDGGLLYIKLLYTVKSTNSRFNMVFPFYLNEAKDNSS